MGTPEFAVPSLKILLAEHEVVAVVTQPDRKRGRGQKYTFSPVKEVAVKHGLPILQPEKINVPEVISVIEEYNADLFVVVAYGHKLPDSLLAMPPLGCVNVHSSLLPKYRGAAPINKAIVEGETVTGVTTMYMGPGWDDGDIILQSEEPILPTDTAGSLHDRLMVLGAELLAETVRQIERGTAPRQSQDHSQATYAFKLKKEDGWVDFNRPAQELERLIRGMNPWPVAHTEINGETVKIWQARLSDKSGRVGEILNLNEDGLLVACGQGSLLLEKVQRPNGKVISGLDLANGLRLSIGDFLQR